MFSEGGVEAFWIPAYMAKTHPNINTAQDLYDNALVFKDPEDPRKGRFYNCPSGWVCGTLTKILHALMVWMKNSTFLTLAHLKV